MNLTVPSAAICAEPTHPNIWDSYAIPIEYGAEHMRGVLTTESLNFSSSNKGVVKTHLLEIGLPFQLEKFISGNGYDLLFLKNHGIIVKVGCDHDPIDLIHPCFSQPLWWATDEKSAINTCVYAGEKLVSEKPTFTASKLREIVKMSEQGETDISGRNIGFAGDLPILIDVDAVYNTTTSKRKSTIKQRLAKHWLGSSGLSQAEVTRNVLFQVYGRDKKLQPWLAQFDRHQPLRRTFWEVQKTSGQERKDSLRNLWATVADWTQNPRLDGTQLHRDYLIPPAA